MPSWWRTKDSSKSCLLFYGTSGSRGCLRLSWLGYGNVLCLGTTWLWIVFSQYSSPSKSLCGSHDSSGLVGKPHDAVLRFSVYDKYVQRWNCFKRVCPPHTATELRKLGFSKGPGIGGSDCERMIINHFLLPLLQNVRKLSTYATISLCKLFNCIWLRKQYHGWWVYTVVKRVHPPKNCFELRSCFQVPFFVHC